MRPKCQDKNLNILRMKRVFKMKYKSFFIIFKGLSLKQIKISFLEGESLTLIFIHHDVTDLANHEMVKNTKP